MRAATTAPAASLRGIFAAAPKKPIQPLRQTLEESRAAAHHKRMPRRVLIWLLSVTLAAAPLAPAWAMARATGDLTRGAVRTNGAADAPSTHARHHAAPNAEQSVVVAPLAGDATAGTDRHSRDSAQATAASHLHAHRAAAQQAPHAAPHAPAPTMAPAASTAPDAHVHSQQMAAGHSSSDCGDGRCDGQCCAVCILTLAASVPRFATVAFGVSESPAYRTHAYTSFVPTLLGRPPQSQS